MKQQSVLEMLAVIRRTKYLFVPPTWRERTPPSDRKWRRSERSLAAVAASLVNTRTASLTSDEGVQLNQEEEEYNLDNIYDFLGVAHWTELGQARVMMMMRKMIMMMNVEDKEKVCVSKLRCLVLLRCQLLKVKGGESNLTDEEM